jgi:hypothetical protein
VLGGVYDWLGFDEVDDAVFENYVTNIPTMVMAAGEVIGKYHDLRHVERSFRMFKSDLRARLMAVWQKLAAVSIVSATLTTACSHGRSSLV